MRRLRRAGAQAAFDAGVQLRNGEHLLLTLVIPVLALVALTEAHVPDLGAARRIDVVAPGVLALAILSTAFTGQAIAVGFDRRHGVLRLLGATPLGRGGLVAGRVGAVLLIEGLQVAVVAAAAVSLGWRPQAGGIPAAAAFVLAGTAALVSAGLLVGGVLRAEAALAAANLAWLLLLGAGAVVLPETTWGGTPATLLPGGALGTGLRAALSDGHVAWGCLAVLLGWAAAAALAASRWFRWD